MRTEAAWATNTRPDVGCAVHCAAQVTEEREGAVRSSHAIAEQCNPKDQMSTGDESQISQRG